MLLPDEVLERLATGRLIDALLTIGAFIFAGYACWVVLSKFLKKFWPGLLTFIRFVQAFGKLPTFMDLTKCKLDDLTVSVREIRHEVFPNAGGSLADQVDTIGLRMESVEARLTNDFKKIKELEDTIPRRVAAREFSRGNPISHELPTFPSQNTED